MRDQRRDGLAPQPSATVAMAAMAAEQHRDQSLPTDIVNYYIADEHNVHHANMISVFRGDTEIDAAQTYGTTQLAVPAGQQVRSAVHTAEAAVHTAEAAGDCRSESMPSLRSKTSSDIDDAEQPQDSGQEELYAGGRVRRQLVNDLVTDVNDSFSDVRTASCVQSRSTDQLDDSETTVFNSVFPTHRLDSVVSVETSKPSQYSSVAITMLHKYIDNRLHLADVQHSGRKSCRQQRLQIPEDNALLNATGGMLADSTATDGREHSGHPTLANSSTTTLESEILSVTVSSDVVVPSTPVEVVDEDSSDRTSEGYETSGSGSEDSYDRMMSGSRYPPEYRVQYDYKVHGRTGWYVLSPSNSSSTGSDGEEES